MDTSLPQQLSQDAATNQSSEQTQTPQQAENFNPKRAAAPDADKYQLTFPPLPRKRLSSEDSYTIDDCITDPRTTSFDAKTNASLNQLQPTSSAAQNPNQKPDETSPPAKQGVLLGGMARVRAMNVSRIDKRLQAIEPVLEKVDEIFTNLKGVPQADKANAAYALYCMRADIMARAQAFIEGTLKAPSGFPSAEPLPSPGQFSVPSVQDSVSTRMGSNKDHTLPQRPVSFLNTNESSKNKQKLSFKQALTSNSVPQPSASSSHRSQTVTSSQTNQTANHDNRIFVRLSQNSQLRQADLGPIAPRIRNRIPQTANAIQTVHRTNTGIAVVPLPGKANVIVAAASQIAQVCGAASAEKADPWIKLLLARVPYRVQRLNENLYR